MRHGGPKARHSTKARLLLRWLFIARFIHYFIKALGMILFHIQLKKGNMVVRGVSVYKLIEYSYKMHCGSSKSNYN